MEDVVKPEDKNELLDTFFHQATIKDPFLSFSRSGDDSGQWIELLQALEKQDIPGWPLLTPMKVQTRKCEKCSNEYCSGINYRRHTRVQHRSKKLDKETKKEREELGVFWDKLSVTDAKELTSFKNVTLEDIPGSSIVKALETLVRKPGFSVLPQAYMRAGNALLNIIEADQPWIPISSQEFFNILDDASEKTFLWGTAVSMEKYLFDGEAGKNGLETKNIVSCTSYLVENKLVKAWSLEKNAAAMKFQDLLMEEEDDSVRRRSEQQEKKRQKKQRQKKARDQKKADDTKAGTKVDDTKKIDSPLADVKETGDDILEDFAETCSLLAAPGDDILEDSAQNQDMLLTEASSYLDQSDLFGNEWQTITKKKAKGQRQGEKADVKDTGSDKRETQRPAVTGSPSPLLVSSKSKQLGGSGSIPNQRETQQRATVTSSPSPASYSPAPAASQVSSKRETQQRPAVTGSPSPASYSPAPAALQQVSSKRETQQPPAVTGSPSPASYSPAPLASQQVSPKQVGSPGGSGQAQNQKKRAKKEYKVVSPKSKVGNDGESPKTTTTSQNVATSQPDETKIIEFPIGSVPASQDVATSQPDETKSVGFPIGSVPASQDVVTSQPDETKSVEFPIGSVPAAQDVATSQPDETLSVEFLMGSVPVSVDKKDIVEAIQSTVWLWMPDGQSGFKDLQVGVNAEFSVDGGSNGVSLQSFPTDKGKSSTENTLSLLRKSLFHGQSNFNYEEAKVMLEQRWEETISAEHVTLVLTPKDDPQESPPKLKRARSL